jgi:restriction endonuclease Mrr
VAAYYRRKKRHERYTIDEKKRYWDQKTLEDPEKIPSDYDYNVPKVPAPQAGPYPSEFGLSDSVTQVLTYYRDRSTKEPYCFESRVRENLGDLGLTLCGTLLSLGLLALLANSSRGSNKLLDFLAIATVGIGGVICIIQLFILIITPIEARLARSRFAKLSLTSGPSKLLDGKTLIEAQLAFDGWQQATEARKSEYARKCEERTAEIWRRHRLRVEKLMAAKELERQQAEERARVARIEHDNMMANRELLRLQQEQRAKAEKYEYENFHRVAMNLEYWTAGSTSEKKGLNLERKFGILLKRLGYTVKFTPKTGDDGIDILAKKDDITIAVQCKNYDAKVGASEIRDFAGALKFYRESKPNATGWLIAPNGFSESTFEKFHRPGDVELLDFNDIRRFVENLDQNYSGQTE